MIKYDNQFLLLGKIRTALAVLDTTDMQTCQNLKLLSCMATGAMLLRMGAFSLSLSLFLSLAFSGSLSLRTSLDQHCTRAHCYCMSDQTVIDIVAVSQRASIYECK